MCTKRVFLWTEVERVHQETYWRSSASEISSSVHFVCFPYLFRLMIMYIGQTENWTFFKFAQIAKILVKIQIFIIFAKSKIFNFPFVGWYSLMSWNKYGKQKKCVLDDIFELLGRTYDYWRALEKLPTSIHKNYF